VQTLLKNILILFISLVLLGERPLFSHGGSDNCPDECESYLCPNESESLNKKGNKERRQ
tara:strand:- start:175 stop:351 length:177 start_codon:yes stop_codon:yes gene_type:complete